MSDTLYLLLDKNIQTLHPHIYLQDIASLSCSNSKLLNRLRVMPVVNLPPDKPGRYVISVMDLISKIQQKEPDLEITPMGEPTFIITYKNKPGPGLLWEWIKILFVGLSTFFGAAIYTQVTGRISDHFTILEITYSIGIGLGVLFFFNHFGHRKLTADPTPMQIQMRLYEDDVNTTIIEETNRTQNTDPAPYK